MAKHTGPKKRGAQPGNTNALRHGFYSRKFLQLEAEDLDCIKGGLHDEIAMLRVTIRRVFDLASDLGESTLAPADPDNPDGPLLHRLQTISHVLSTLGTASTRLAQMLRTQKFLDGGGDPLEDLIALALEELDSGGQPCSPLKSPYS